MKNVIILFLIFLAFSCENKSDCYECTITFNVTQSDTVESVSWSVSDTKTLCDMTEEQIRMYEINSTDTTSYVSGGVTTKTISLAECAQQ